MHQFLPSYNTHKTYYKHLETSEKSIATKANNYFFVIFTSLKFTSSHIMFSSLEKCSAFANFLLGYCMLKHIVLCISMYQKQMH